MDQRSEKKGGGRGRGRERFPVKAMIFESIFKARSHVCGRASALPRIYKWATSTESEKVRRWNLLRHHQLAAASTVKYCRAQVCLVERN
ncbi:hypothetical protein H6P81_001230 [Aristolochia fimbriata]|uniref:Uncharacterized protein n=1 Tax=Aristolochia fimbriata TaxID=158543 RepID=A0AAV7FAB0_ARIFI|nr:hypothetical protein H6P81_001230 [Aristolochia fimbriata]